MKALGVSSLRDYLQGKQSLEQATYLAKGIPVIMQNAR